RAGSRRGAARRPASETPSAAALTERGPAARLTVRHAALPAPDAPTRSGQRDTAGRGPGSTSDESAQDFLDRPGAHQRRSSSVLREGTHAPAVAHGGLSAV